MLAFVFYELNTEHVHLFVLLLIMGEMRCYVLRTNVPNPFVNTNRQCTDNKTYVHA